MEPTQFEKTLKAKLEKRKIQPAKDSWETLSKRLDAEDRKNRFSGTTYWWLGIAAGIAGIVLIAFQFLNTKKVITPQIVVTPKVENKTAVDLKATPIETPQLLQTEPQHKVAARQSKPKAVEQVKPEITPVEDLPQNINPNTEVAEEILSFEDKKVQELVAQINTLKANKTEVTDAEIDALLLQAQQDIMLHELYQEDTELASATLLLQEVETELDQSFRIKVFEALKTSYHTVKVAIVKRKKDR